MLSEVNIRLLNELKMLLADMEEKSRSYETAIPRIKGEIAELEKKK